MTETPQEPAGQPDANTDDGPAKPKAPDLPDPAFPEVLPGGEDAPDQSGNEDAPDQSGNADD